MNKIKKTALKGGILGHFIDLMYAIFSNTIISSIILFVLSTIIIPINISKVSDNSTFIDYLKVLWIPTLLVILVLILSNIALKYKTKYLKDFETAKFALRNILVIHESWCEKLNETISELIEEDSISMYKFKQSYLKHSQYNKRASFLVKILFSLFEKTYKTDNFQITIMHRGQDQQGEYIKMIAFCNKDRETPGSFKNKYYLKDDAYSNYYHVKEFNSTKRGVRVLLSNEEINKSFDINSSSKEREERLEQYIGIPIIDDKKEIVSLIQIDTTEKNIFGTNKDDIRFAMDNYIRPLCHFLKTWYKKEELSTILNRVNKS